MSTTIKLLEALTVRLFELERNRSSQSAHVRRARSVNEQEAAALAIATAIAMPAEGLRQWAYRDPVGLPTICFGSTKA